MQPQDIHLNDWQRILLGEVPISFFIELFIRAFVVYLILMVSMRLMGKRMSSQLTRNELAALVSLAAAVGIPLMAPDRGLLPASTIASVLILTERFVAKWSFSNESVGDKLLGKVSTLVSDGVINIKELSFSKLSHERVLAQLRSKGILQLGEVSRFYMESSGSFTLIASPNPVAGLSILPPWDQPMEIFFNQCPDKQICLQCGMPQKPAGRAYHCCPNCGQDKWINAVALRNKNQSL